MLVPHLRPNPPSLIVTQFPGREERLKVSCAGYKWLWLLLLTKIMRLDLRSFILVTNCIVLSGILHHYTSFLEARPVCYIWKLIIINNQSFASLQSVGDQDKSQQRCQCWVWEAGLDRRLVKREMISVEIVSANNLHIKYSQLTPVGLLRPNFSPNWWLISDPSYQASWPRHASG